MTQYARLKFRNIVLESSGNEYEKLFTRIMTYLVPGFSGVHPHGNLGDRGNDGWVKEHGIYYQVYAPDNLPANNAESLKKLKTDLKKLIEYWGSFIKVKEFNFVVNDKFRSPPPHLEKAIEEVRVEHSLVKTKVFTSSDLENCFFQLNFDMQKAIIGEFIRPEYATEFRVILNIAHYVDSERWHFRSDNLIANYMSNSFLECLMTLSMKIQTTNVPNRIHSLKERLNDLAFHIDQLIIHLTGSEFSMRDSSGWRITKQWKSFKDYPQSEYDALDERTEQAKKKLYMLHSNLAHALNRVCEVVRANLDADYLLGFMFGINDTLGTYNMLEPYYKIPEDFYQTNFF